MAFNLDKSIALLERTPAVYQALLEGLKYNWTHINEGGDTWSAYDIIGHLIHGERTDWIPRSLIILDETIDDKTFEPFDRYAQKQLSQGKSIEQLLGVFEALRADNVTVLRSWKLTEDDLNKIGIHPDLGEVTLRQLLATWTIHDMAHINQISRIMVKHYAADIGPWAAYTSLLKNSAVQ